MDAGHGSGGGRLAGSVSYTHLFDLPVGGGSSSEGLPHVRSGAILVREAHAA